MRWTCLITLATAALLGCGTAPSENRYAPALANIRGEAWSKAGEYDKAIAEYNEALRLAPLFETAYYNRGWAWYFKREYDKAIADFNETLRLNPSDDRALIARGDAWQAKGEYTNAFADYDEAIRLNPEAADAYNNLAWLRATCPEAKYRDGKREGRLPEESGTVP